MIHGEKSYLIQYSYNIKDQDLKKIRYTEQNLYLLIITGCVHTARFSK